MDSKIERTDKDVSLINPINSRDILSIGNLSDILIKGRADRNLLELKEQIINAFYSQFKSAIEDHGSVRKTGLFRKRARLISNSDLESAVYTVFSDASKKMICPDHPYRYMHKAIDPLKEAIKLNRILLKHLFISPLDFTIEKREWEEIVPVTDNYLFFKITKPFTKRGIETKEGLTEDMTLVPYHLRDEHLRYFTMEINKNVSNHFNVIKKFEEDTRRYREDFIDEDKRLEVLLSIIGECCHAFNDEKLSPFKAGYYSAHLNTHLMMLARRIEKEFEELAKSYGNIMGNLRRQIEDHISDEFTERLGYRLTKNGSMKKEIN